MATRKAAFGQGAVFVPNPKLKLLEQMREVCRLKHYLLRTGPAERWAGSSAGWVIRSHDGKPAGKRGLLELVLPDLERSDCGKEKGPRQAAAGLGDNATAQ